MALFNRRKNQNLSDLESYYAARRGRSGTAWLMAILSLIITVAVLAGLFFGGRWLYRELRGDDNTDSNVTTGTVVGTVDSNGNVQGSGDSQSGTVSVNDTPNQSEEFPGVVTDQAASTSTPSTAAAQNDNNVGVAAATNTNLPDTGAGDLLLIAPAFAFVIGYVVSRKRQLN